MTTESTAIEIRGPGLDRHGPPARIEDMKAFLARVSSDEGFKEQQELAAAYDKACRALIGAGDVQVDGDREFKKKSAWRKLGRHFQISTRVVSSKIDFVANRELDEEDRIVMVATVVVEATAVWGQSSEAIGACATDEESGQRWITTADALATAETRATNRSISNLIAMGEVSAEEVRTAGGESKPNEAPKRKVRPAEELRMPFGPSKGKLLGELETKDLEGALRWAEDRSEEKGSPQFADFQKAAREVIDKKKLQVWAGSGGTASDAMDVDAAHKYPFPFQKDKPNSQYGKPLGGMSSEHLTNVRTWILETQREQGDDQFHAKTVKAITTILDHRAKEQGKLDLSVHDGLCHRPAGHKGDHAPDKTDEEYALIASMPEKGGKYIDEVDDCRVPLKPAAAPPQVAQEAKTPAAAPSGGGPQRSERVPSAQDPDPTSQLGLYARIKKALESPAITPEARNNYHTDKVNGFRASKGAKSLEWWVEALERTARMDPESFPAALEDSDDDLPF